MTFTVGYKFHYIQWRAKIMHTPEIPMLLYFARLQKVIPQSEKY